MSRANSILNHKHGFHFQNHGTTTEKASYFFSHVDLGVIELQALKKKNEKKTFPMVEMIWAKIKKETMYE